MSKDTLLIVEDAPDIQTLLKIYFSSQGYEVFAAGRGSDALEVVRKQLPNLVLLDVNLPDLDGFTVAERLTANGAAPIVVLCSSRDAGDFGDLVARSGARGFVAKADLSGAAVRELAA